MCCMRDDDLNGVFTLSLPVYILMHRALALGMVITYSNLFVGMQALSDDR
jgi:hypothetical protein